MKPKTSIKIIGLVIVIGLTGIHFFKPIFSIQEISIGALLNIHASHPVSLWVGLRRYPDVSGSNPCYFSIDKNYIMFTSKQQLLFVKTSPFLEYRMKNNPWTSVEPSELRLIKFNSSKILIRDDYRNATYQFDLETLVATQVFPEPS
jgi:hypothetical protein